MHRRLIKELVVLKKIGKPMAKAGGKDTMHRKKSIELYEDKLISVPRNWV